MTDPTIHSVTKLLADWKGGDAAALDRLTPLVYRELRRLADSYLRRERADHTLQPTALIHEAYLRLVDQSLPQWQNRAHFYGIAARLMRQILVDHARGRAAAKRGNAEDRLPLDEAAVFSKDRPDSLVALDDALIALAELDERKCRVIELRYFGGLSAEETAEALGISLATVGRELRMAEAWLHREMNEK